MPKHKCQSKENCYKLIDIKNRYCDEHKGERFKRYSKDNQDEFSKFYDKSRWKKVRAIAIKHRPLCKCCGALAEEVDHVIELRDLEYGISDSLAYDLTNLNPCCKIHHRRKTEVVKNIRKQGKEALIRYYKTHENDGIFILISV